MAGLVPAIHAFPLFTLSKNVDARDKPGHDGGENMLSLVQTCSLRKPPYASPSVSNIAALMASAAVLPAQTTNWNAG
jgi:hypothetical protein